MNNQLSKLEMTLPDLCLDFIAGAPVVHHCHHFNLFLDQTISDALGREMGWTVRVAAAEESSYFMLSNAFNALELYSTVERIEAAQEIFRALGHGRLQLLVNEEGGEAQGFHLHYSHTWREKYKGKVASKSSMDAFAAGFAAAATAAAHGFPQGSFDCNETHCVASRHTHCHFQIVPASNPSLSGCGGIGIQHAQQTVYSPFSCEDDGIVDSINQALRAFRATIEADENGLISGFGVFITQHLATYYNLISFKVLKVLEQQMPEIIPALEELLRESGHVCVFHTFGGIMLSPEMEAITGRSSTTYTPRDIVQQGAGIGRALGFGRWSICEFIPNRKLVLRSPQTYESVHYQYCEGTPSHGIDYFLQGAAMAIMRLAHDVNWSDPSLALDAAEYKRLFRGKAHWKVEQIQCAAAGDSSSTIVITRIE